MTWSQVAHAKFMIGRHVTAKLKLMGLGIRAQITNHRRKGMTAQNSKSAALQYVVAAI